MTGRMGLHQTVKVLNLLVFKAIKIGEIVNINVRLVYDCDGECSTSPQIPQPSKECP